jgi:hypothetical protein
MPDFGTSMMQAFAIEMGIAQSVGKTQLHEKASL